MILIAHRGNTSGPSDKENEPNYIRSALDAGFHAEVDVWKINNEFLLGHDKPKYPIDPCFLRRPNLWCHAKNLDCLAALLEFSSCSSSPHFFWHQDDDYTLTSSSYIWTYPGRNVCARSILVIDNASNYDGSKCFGLCSDYLV